MNGITNTTPHNADAQSVRKAQEDRSVQRSQNDANVSGTAPERSSSTPSVDEYVHGVEPESPGLYRLAEDENGKPKVIFDDPEKQNNVNADSAQEPESSESASAPVEQPPEEEKAEEAKDKTEKCTVSTDRVDAEIKSLEQRKSQLAQQLAREKNNPDGQAKLQKELQQVDSELSVKNTDSYRKQHAQYTNG